MQIGLVIIGTLSLFAGLGFATGYLTAKREFEVNLPGEDKADEQTGSRS